MNHARPGLVGVLTRTLLTKRITIQGFIMFEDFGEVVAQMIAWFQVGTIKFREDIVDGLEKAPQASSARWGRISASCWTRSYYRCAA